jgi:hypothetical protein
LAIYGHKLKEEQIKDIVYQECSLSHPNKSVSDAQTSYCICMANLINTGDITSSLSKAKSWLLENGEPEVMEWFSLAEKKEDVPFHPQSLILFIFIFIFYFIFLFSKGGFVKIAYVYAFRFLMEEKPFEESLGFILTNGGDTDTSKK